jgi:hypothetical protein
MVPSDIFMLSVIAFSLIIGFLSFSAMVTRVGRNSGIFASKLESGKKLVPAIFDEISHIEPESLHQNFHNVTEPFTIKTKNKVFRFDKDSTLFRIPLTGTLEGVVGVYLATMNTKKSTIKFSKEFLEPSEKEAVLEKLSTNFSIKSVRKFSHDDWKKIRGKTTPLPSEQAISKLGFKSEEEFNQKVQIGLTGIKNVQEQIRARVRGLPTITNNPDKFTVIWQGESHIAIPQEIITQLSEKGASILEIIPGKEEYLFYVKIRL